MKSLIQKMSCSCTSPLFYMDQQCGDGKEKNAGRVAIEICEVGVGVAYKPNYSFRERYDLKKKTEIERKK